MGHRERHRAELLLHLAPKDERPLIEQDVTPLTIDVRKEHGLDEPVAVIEGGELHGLVLEGVDRLGGGEHPGGQHVPAYVAVQLGAGAEPEPPEVVGVKPHGVLVGDEAQGGMLLLPPALGGILLEHRDGGRQVIEPIPSLLAG
jgi:hypothetical protein